MQQRHERSQLQRTTCESNPVLPSGHKSIERTSCVKVDDSCRIQQDVGMNPLYHSQEATLPQGQQLELCRDMQSSELIAPSTKKNQYVTHNVEADDFVTSKHPKSYPSAACSTCFVVINIGFPLTACGIHPKCTVIE
eukprot:1450544-Amphidinium_carterae.1